MKKFHLLILSLLCLTILAGCASSAIPQQIPDALGSACQVYTTAKPQVLEVRADLVAHWNDKVPGTDRDLIPAETKAKLEAFDRDVLPKLDGAGLAICAASRAVDVVFTGGKKFDANQALDIVFKAASFALEMKAKGAF